MFVAGTLLTIIPFLGIPQWWMRGLVVFFGVLLLLIGYSLRRARFLSTIDRGNGERGTDSFVETTAPLFSDRVSR